MQYRPELRRPRKERCSLPFIMFVSQSEVLLRSCAFQLKTRPGEGFLQEQAEGADQALLSWGNCPERSQMMKKGNGKFLCD